MAEEKPRVTIVAFADEESRHAEEHLQYCGERNIPISVRSFSFDEQARLDNLGALTGKAFKDKEGELKKAGVVKHITQATPDELARYQGLIDKYGVEVWDIGSALGKQYIGEPDFHTKFLSCLEATVAVAKFFRTGLIRSFTFYPGMEKELRETKPDKLAELFERYRDDACGLNLGYHTLLNALDITPVLEVEGNLYGHDGPSLVEIADELDFEPFMYFDGGNMVQQDRENSGLSYTTFLEMANYLVGVHVKDMKPITERKDGAAVDEEKAWPYVPVGQGAAQYDRVFADLAGMIPVIEKRLKECGLPPKVGVVLEPHLICGGQFGGFTGRRMDKALEALTRMLDSAGIVYQSLHR